MTGTAESTRNLAATDSWDSGLLGSGASYKRQFDTAGTYTYEDSGNPGITGQIIVSSGEEKLYLPIVRK
jgi:plastocyanin